MSPRGVDIGGTGSSRWRVRGQVVGFEFGLDVPEELVQFELFDDPGALLFELVAGFELVELGDGVRVGGEAGLLPAGFLVRDLPDQSCAWETNVTKAVSFLKLRHPWSNQSEPYAPLARLSKSFCIDHACSITAANFPTRLCAVSSLSLPANAWKYWAT